MGLDSEQWSFDPDPCQARYDRDLEHIDKLNAIQTEEQMQANLAEYIYGTQDHADFLDRKVGWRPVAYGLALAPALCWALYSNFARLWSGPGKPGAVELFIPVTALVLLGLRCVLSESSNWSTQAILEASVLGGITALGYVLWDAAMRNGGLLLVAACGYFTPLLSTMVSCAYLNVFPGSRLWIGCALVVIGSLVSWRASAAVPGSGSKKRLFNGPRGR